MDNLLNSKKDSVYIHPLADVQTLNIGDLTKIWQFCVILKSACIGNNCNICANVFIENDVIIGDNVTIKCGVQIWDGIRIGNNVFIGPNVTFTNDLVPRSKIYPENFLKTKVDDNVSIGANSTILAGIKLGSHCFIGAGSVVTKNVSSYEVWYGNPAKHMGYITKKGVILDLNMTDKKTRDKYILFNNEIIKEND